MDEQQPPGGAAMHVPVLRERVLALLAPALVRPDAGGVGATLGLGGHAAALLAAHPQLRLIGIDRDPQALARSADRLAAHRERVTLGHRLYDPPPAVLTPAGVERVDGVLFDLGVSSLQLDETARGFSYSRDTALDMR